MVDNQDLPLQEQHGPPTGRGRWLSCLSSVLVLMLGIFPWLDIRCEGKPASTQNGYQIGLGRYTQVESTLPDMDVLGSLGERKTEGPFDQQDHTPRAPLVGAFFVLIFSGLLTGLFVRPTWLAVRTLAFCHFLAIGAMLNQMILGFPTEKLVVGLSRSSKITVNPFSNGTGPPPAAELKYTYSLWITLIVAGLPPAILAAGWLCPMAIRRLRLRGEGPLSRKRQDVIP